MRHRCIFLAVMLTTTVVAVGCAGGGDGEATTTGAPAGVEVSASTTVLDAAPASTTGPPTTIATTTTTEPRMITLTTPAGWASSDDGLVVAGKAADLAAAVPSGPRARLMISTLDTASGSGPFSESSDATIDPEILVGPEQVTVGTRAAVAVTLVETDAGVRIVRRYLVMGGSDGSGYLVVLEAPETLWPDSEALLATIPTAS